LRAIRSACRVAESVRSVPRFVIAVERTVR
jgi:hypothetical protein